MSERDPVILAEPDNGLQLVRWRVEGFLELRRCKLLSPRYDYELVDGLVLMREYGGPLHRAVVAELRLRLEDACAEPVDVDRELVLDDQQAVVTPDIAVGRRLVVEVSTDASRLDGSEKARLYAREGFEVYWQLDLAWGLFYVHKSPHADGYGARSCSPRDFPVLSGVPELDGWRFDELLAAARRRIQPAPSPV